MKKEIGIVSSMKGHWQDVIVRKEPGKPEEVIVTPLTHNEIVTTVSQLMAGLFVGTYQSNYLFFALGTGSQGMSIDVTNLVSEVSRKQVTIGYVDSNNNITTSPTSNIVCSVSWAEGELASGNNVVSLTEFGIFGGSGANTANGGLMVDYVAHSPISINAYTSISRKVYFSF